VATAVAGTVFRDAVLQQQRAPASLTTGEGWRARECCAQGASGAGVAPQCAGGVVMA